MARPSRKRSGQAIRDKAGTTIFSPKHYLIRKDEAVPRLYIIPTCLPAPILRAPHTTCRHIFKTIVLQTFPQ
jgi:hypothetical protein